MKLFKRVDETWIVRKRLLVPTLAVLCLFMAQPILTLEDSDPTRRRLTAFIRSVNHEVVPRERDAIVTTILREAPTLAKATKGQQMDGRPLHAVHFLAAVIAVESSFRKEAVSRADAHGYMQLQKPTARWVAQRNNWSEPRGSQIRDRETNIRTGAAYLAMLFDRFEDPRRVALAYNAGPGNLSRGVFTERYWLKIQSAYRVLQTP